MGCMIQCHATHASGRRRGGQHGHHTDNMCSTLALRSSMHLLSRESTLVRYHTQAKRHMCMCSTLALRSSMHLLLREANSRRNLPRKGAEGSSRIVPACLQQSGRSGSSFAGIGGGSQHVPLEAGQSGAAPISVRGRAQVPRKGPEQATVQRTRGVGACR